MAIALCLAVVVAVGYSLEPMRRSACQSPSSIEIPAPDGRHVARLFTTLCDTGLGDGTASTAQLVAVRRADDGRSNGEESVFITFDTPPAVAWRDASHLVITLQAVEPIHRSRHSAGDIRVVYRLAPALRNGDAQARVNPNLRPDSAVLGTSSEREIIKARAAYAEFLDWAKDNAEAE